MSEDQKAKVKAYWDEQAAKGADNPLATTHDKLLRILEIDNILKHIPDEPLRIADVGCGTGYSTIEFAKVRQASFVGFDYSQNMIDEAVKLQTAEQKNLKGTVSFAVGDVTNLRSLNLEPFDIVTTDRCLINLMTTEEQQTALKEIWEILKPGGAYIMCEGSKQGFAKVNELRAAAELPIMQNYWHNLYIDEEKVLPFVETLFECLAVENFASTYYIASRIFNAVNAADPQKPDYLSIINRTAIKLPPIGDYSPLRIYYLRKKI